MRRLGLIDLGFIVSVSGSGSEMAGSGRRMAWFCCVVLLLVVVDGAVAFERRVDWDQARVVGKLDSSFGVWEVI